MSDRISVALVGWRSSPGMRRVLISYGLFGMIEFSVWLAVLLYAYDIGGASLAGLAAVVQLVPAIILVPFLGGMGDRLPRVKALVLAYLVVAASTALVGCLLVLSAPPLLVLVGGMVVTTAISLVRPVHFSLLPGLAPDPASLVSGNSLSSCLDGITLFLGPVLAGLAAQTAGPWLVFAVGTAFGVAAALLCRGVTLVSPPEPPPDHRGMLREAVGGLVALWGNWAALTLVVIMGVRFVIEGAMDVMGVTFASTVLGGESSTAGVLVGATGAGMLAGAMAAATLARRQRLTSVVIGGGVLSGLAVAAVALLSSLAPVLLCVVIAGIGGSVLLVSGRTLLQRNVADDVLSRVFAVQEGTSMLGLAIGAALAPLLISAFGPAGAYVPLGLGIALLVLVAARWIRSLDATAELHLEEVALLAQVPALSVVPPFELESLAATATWLQLEAGEELEIHGRDERVLFVLQSGELEDVEGASARARELGPGACFGDMELCTVRMERGTLRAATEARILMLGESKVKEALVGE